MNTKEQLISIVTTYIKAVKSKDFTMIPYAENVTLRSPFTKEGVRQQLQGKKTLFSEWWTPLILNPTDKEIIFEITDYYFNESLTSIIAEMVITDYNFTPTVTLWAAERFTLNEAGEIIDQINHFDVRDAVSPNWQENI